MIKKTKKTRFALVRHAETTWNVSGRIQGQDDSPLTMAGIMQARAWGNILVNKEDWSRVISSDSGRARKTAVYVNESLNLDIILERRLREQDWGIWTGKTLPQIKLENPGIFAEHMDTSWKFHPPEGEDRITVLERSLDSLRDAQDKWPGENILIITHEGVIKCIISHLREIQPEKQVDDSFLSNHLHWISHTHEGPRLEKLNALLLP